jgi:hypothetical protein
MIEVYACDFSGNGVFVMFIADLLQNAPRNHKQEPPRLHRHRPHA